MTDSNILLLALMPVVGALASPLVVWLLSRRERSVDVMSKMVDTLQAELDRQHTARGREATEWLARVESLESRLRVMEHQVRDLTLENVALREQVSELQRENARLKQG